jgi:1,4-alpha-glucan branching enzyme
VVVTFRLPPDVAADAACVVGEFNGWSTTSHPMTLGDDGFVAAIPLEPGRSYRFRYVLDGERWENDWAADAYVPNEFGGDDSVIDLTRTGDPTDADGDAAEPVAVQKRRRRAEKGSSRA